jgi:nucleoside-diphosphate-sugar epimerase
MRGRNERRLHAVLGTGPLGLAVARYLTDRGDRVRAANRAGRADLPEDVEVLGANVAEAADATRACDGAAVVYHCANPPYAKWPELHPPLMDAIIAGAAATGARLVFADNLYAYGPVDGPLTEDLPYLAKGPNGRSRARIAETLMRAHEAGRIQATIGRGSDFFGPYAHLSTVGDRVLVRAIEGKPAHVLGNPDLPHTVTYIEDFARALVTLGEREVAMGEVWHVPNAETVTMRRFVQMVFEAAGQPARLRAAPRWGSPSPPCSIRRCERSESSSTSPSDPGWSTAPSSSGPPHHCPKRSPRRSRGSGMVSREARHWRHR